jgi:hypothetical protein
MVRLFLIDVMNDKAEELNIEPYDLDKFHELLNCRCFAIPKRRIGGKYFDIYCDDEGLIKDEQPPVSAYSISKREPMLVGNLIIANHDMAGDTIDLSDEDIKLIKENLIFATSPAKPNGYKLLACEY